MSTQDREILVVAGILALLGILFFANLLLNPKAPSVWPRLQQKQ